MTEPHPPGRDHPRPDRPTPDPKLPDPELPDARTPHAHTPDSPAANPPMAEVTAAPGAPGPPRPRWGLPSAAGSLAGFALASLVVSSLLFYAGLDSILASVLGTIAGWFFLAGWPLWAASRRGNGVRLDLALTLRRSDIGLGLLAAFVVFGVAVIFLLVYFQITGEMPSSALGDTAESATEAWQIVALALLAIGAPFAEELHFRGMWWSALRRRGLGGWPTLIVTSLLFALVHLEPTRLPLLFAAGFAAGFVRMITGRLGPAIMTHLTVNGVAALGLLSLI